jgi:hypothetical protein
VPEDDKYGMIAFIKKKKFFPNVKMKYCTQSLKITPMHRWLKANKLNRKNSDI